MTRSSHARRSLVDPRRVLWALLLPLVVPTAGLGQDLVGCQLLEGTLQCVPGTTASPQQQIRILEGEIQRDRALEGAVEQGIRALGPLVPPRPRPPGVGTHPRSQWAQLQPGSRGRGLSGDGDRGRAEPHG
jgi:hypothetical protein